MFVSGIATAVPAARYTKAECWDAFRHSVWFQRLDRRAHAIAEAVLTRDNGIAARRLALDSLDEVFTIDPDTLEARFERHAPGLAAQAAMRALGKAGLDASAIDAVVVSTCTGYLCPGLTGHLVERVGLRADVRTFDLVGQGCAAALPNWQLADALLEARRCEHVLSVCVEVSSAAMFLDNDPGVLVSACLFGDGAGAAILSRTAPVRGRRVEWQDVESYLEPKNRNALRFERQQGMLRNVLTRPVPRLAADAALHVLQAVLRRRELDPAQIRTWIMHAGGRDVLQALADRLGIADHDLRYSAAILREYGNMSSAFIYFVLEAALDDAADGGWWWMSSFGAGFACHGALLAVAA